MMVSASAADVQQGRHAAHFVNIHHQLQILHRCLHPLRSTIMPTKQNQEKKVLFLVEVSGIKLREVFYCTEAIDITEAKQRKSKALTDR
jgi:hypothetical protein